MNKTEKRALSKEIGKLEGIALEGEEFESIEQREALRKKIADVSAMLNIMYTNEESKFDGMRPSFRLAPTGQAIQTARDALGEAGKQLDKALACFEGDTFVVKDPQAIDDYVTSACDELDKILAGAEK